MKRCVRCFVCVLACALDLKEKQVFALKDDVEVVFSESLEDVSAGALPGHEPIVQLDDHDGGLGEPWSRFQKYLRFGSFNVHLHEKETVLLFELKNFGDGVRAEYVGLSRRHQRLAAHEVGMRRCRREDSESQDGMACSIRRR